MDKILDHLKTIVIQDPTDLIIDQIRQLIKDGKLRPGDRLPSEASLQNKFQVKRGVVRDALKKLEFYGILKTIPQSGTIVANLGPQALQGLIANILKLERGDYESLIDTRIVLEGHAAALAAERAGKAILDEIEALERGYEEQAHSGDRGLNADICFHLKIAEAAKSSVLNSLITLMTPDILQMFHELTRTSAERLNTSIEEHRSILEAIQTGRAAAAERLMREHISNGYRYSLV